MSPERLVSLFCVLTTALFTTGLAAESMYAVTEKAKLYSAPDPLSEVIAELPKDTEVTLYQTRVKWIYVTTNDAAGWVKTSDFSRTKGGSDNKRETVHARKRGYGASSGTDEAGGPAESPENQTQNDNPPPPPQNPQPQEQPSSSEQQ